MRKQVNIIDLNICCYVNFSPSRASAGVCSWENNNWQAR